MRYHSDGGPGRTRHSGMTCFGLGRLRLHARGWTVDDVARFNLHKVILYGIISALNRHLKIAWPLRRAERSVLRTEPDGYC
jgi:hypothetical protein